MRIKIIRIISADWEGGKQWGEGRLEVLVRAAL